MADEQGTLFLERLQQINALLADLPATVQVDVLSVVWLFTASTARSEALPEPGGYPAERARQLERLAKMTEFVAQDEPDLETERLAHEEDYEGLLQRLQQQLKDLHRDNVDDERRDETGA